MDPNLILDRSSNTEEEDTEEEEEEEDDDDDKPNDDDVDKWWRASSEVTKATIILALRGLFLGVLSLWTSTITRWKYIYIFYKVINKNSSPTNASFFCYHRS